MPQLFKSVIYSFMVAFGIVLGACFFAGIAAIINNNPPMKTMQDMADNIKIWAVAAALGGTFTSLEIIEKGLFKGELKSIIKQLIFIAATLWGANLGCRFIGLIRRCGEIWLK